MNSLILIVLLVCASIPRTGFTQERRKITISNATLSYSALPLVAAREWKLFEEQALNVEVILMRSAEAAASSQIEKPEDLIRKKDRMDQYRLTVGLWARGILQERYGVRPQECEWFTSEPPACVSLLG